VAEIEKPVAETQNQRNDLYWIIIASIVLLIIALLIAWNLIF